MRSAPAGWNRGAIAALAFTCVLLVPPRGLPAQDAPPLPSAAPRDRPLTLAEILATVDRRSPRVHAAAAFARASATRVAGATKPPDPTLQLGLMNYLLPGLQADPTLGMRQLQLMQMLPLPGKLTAAGDAARARSAAASALAEEVRSDARTTAAMAFYERAVVLRQVAIARETRRLLEDVAAVAAAMYRVGDGRQVDVLRAQVEIARMDAEVLRMLAMDASAQSRLAAALDLPLDSLNGTPVLPEFPDSVPTREALETLALTSRPMLAAGVAEVDAASADLRLATRDRWPDLQVGLQYGERASAMGTERMGSLMVGAALPIWARSRQLAMRDEAGAMRAMAEADLATMRAATRGRVGEVHAELVSVRDLAALYRGSVLPQAEAAAIAALASYRTGAVDFMTVIDDRMTVNRYRQELVALDATQGRAWAELEMLTGRPLLAAAAIGARGGDR